MKVDKYILFISFIFLNNSMHSHAEKIDFQGSISEFTCEHHSKESRCKAVQIALSTIKTKQKDKDNKTNIQSNQIANIIAEQSVGQNKKVITLIYH